MQYKIRNTTDTLGCQLETDKKMHFTSNAFCAYGQETLAYAACRYIRHCPRLRDRLIYEAVRLGLNPKGGKKRIFYRVRTKAARLSLPGGDVLLTLCVSQGRITLKGVFLQ